MFIFAGLFDSYACSKLARVCRLARDVLIMRPPRILYSHSELYAVPALFGMSICALGPLTCETVSVASIIR